MVFQELSWGWIYSLKMTSTTENGSQGSSPRSVRLVWSLSVHWWERRSCMVLSRGLRAAPALFTPYSAPTHVGAQCQLHIRRRESSSEEVRCLQAMLPTASTSLSLKTLFLERKLFSALSHKAVSFTKVGIWCSGNSLNVSIDQRIRWALRVRKGKLCPCGR